MPVRGIYDGIYDEIADKESDKGEIAARVISDPELLPKILDGFSAKKAAVRYGCGKVILEISETEPKALYRRFKFFTDLLDSENNIFRWQGILVIGNLAKVDSRKKIDAILEQYLEPITGPALTTAANTIKAAGKIALAKPRLADRIVAEFLKVENATYEKDECRNIAIGKCLEALLPLVGQVEDAAGIGGFARRQLRNSRGSTQKKAAKLLKKMGE